MPNGISFAVIAIALSAVLSSCSAPDHTATTSSRAPVLVCEQTTLIEAAGQIAAALCPVVGDPEDVKACRDLVISGYCDPSPGPCDAQLCGSQVQALADCLEGIGGTGDVVPACTKVFEPPTPDSALFTALEIEAATGRAAEGPGAPTFDGNVWTFGNAFYGVRYPIPVQAGDQITGYKVFVTKSTSQPVSVFLEQHVGALGHHEAIGPQVYTTQPSGIVALGRSGLSEVVAPGTSYSLRVYGSWVGGDQVANAEVTVLRH